ncbi:hypothetical protein [Mycobacterium palustre]|uniref:Uncharacterized protein n=1 Tax=Mycobacterium palustre TaxID=153971 RepID=A0A1X1ZVR9_9MYCO|nr:hypothetical protein [Mycobacterium palustre]MCV7101575.1 hypothetical protein [Mycobacterium palustre]ORW28215.1 hypothetical protein AWC19_27675 [Mycobacterium palustre]
MGSKAPAVVHRLRQARAAALRVELAVTGAQILFWAALIGLLAGLALRWRHHRTRREAPTPKEADAAAPPPTTDAVVSAASTTRLP